MTQPSSDRDGVASALGLDKADEIRGKLGFLIRLALVGVDYPDYAAGDPGIDQHLQDLVLMGRVGVGLCLDLVGYRHDVAADLGRIALHAHGDLPQSGCEVRGPELRVVEKHLNAHVQGKALIYAQGKGLVIVAGNDLDQVVVLVDVAVLLELIDIAAYGASVHADASCYVGFPESFRMASEYQLKLCYAFSFHYGPLFPVLNMPSQEYYNCCEQQFATNVCKR